MLRKSIMGLALAAALIGGGIATAADGLGSLSEGKAIATNLGGSASALTYWTNAAGGWNVVTTIDTIVADAAAPDEARHAIVRFSAAMLPGQSQVISVPEPIGAPSRELHISRLGDRIEVALVRTPPGA